MKVFQDFEYEIHLVGGGKAGEFKNKVISIGRYLGTETDVVIPDEIEGFPVNQMKYTFCRYEKLERVTLPKKLTILGTGVFSGCNKLKTVYFPSSLQKIEGFAFEKCTSLEEITIPDNMVPVETLTLKQLAFDYCPRLCDENGFIILKNLLLNYQGSETHVTIPDGIIKISESAFFKHSTVTSVNMPDSVKIIGTRAFHECKLLTEINLSKELNTIGAHAFSYCYNLEKIRLPEHLTEIENNVFSFCKSLKEIHWNTGLKGISDNAFESCTSLEEISFPENLNYIKKSFSHCENLRKITIPPSVHTISNQSFIPCDSLEIIEILDRPEGTKELKLRTCFPYSGKMRENVLEKGQEVPEIIVESFTKEQTMQYLKDLFISWDLIAEEEKDMFRQEWKKRISIKVQKGTNLLRNIVFLESTAKEMGIYFKEGFQLELPELEDYLEFSIKNGNTAETAVLLDYKNKTYSKDYLEEIETRKNLIDLGLELPTLKELREKWTVTTRKDHIMINGYHGKSKVEILPPTLAGGKPIRKITNTTYNGFETLKRLTLSEGIEEIGEKAFFRTSLEVIHLPSTLNKIDKSAFWMSELTKVTIPDGLTVLESEAFMQCVHLVKVNLGNTIKEIKNNTFSLCVSLEEIQFPKELERIEFNAFNNCKSLKEIKLPSKLKKIDKKAFSYCPNLKKVILGSDVLEIDPSAFDGCGILEFVGLEGGENLLHNIRRSRKHE